MKNKTDEYWKSKLTDEQYQVLRKKGTEPRFTGEYVDHHEDGMYHCSACGAALFSSDTKFKSSGWNAGWPSFYDVVQDGNVTLHRDLSHGMTRVEVTCASCGGHLGHLFDDGPKEKGGKHYCINSCALQFSQKK